MSHTELSVVIPIYNDGVLAPEFCSEFCKADLPWNPESLELIFVNDGSSDNSQRILSDLSQKYPFVRVVELSRNFGQHIALSCGYYFSQGKIVGMMNVDLQEHPSQIPLFIKTLLSENSDIVYGLRNKRHSSLSDRLSSYLFNLLLRGLTGYKIPTNVSTMRFMQRRFVDAYNTLNEKNRFLPGLEQWLGFKQAFVPITHQPRQKGCSTYTFTKRLRMAADSIISFSDVPLKATVTLGMVIAFCGLTLIFVLILQKLFFVNFLPGYTSTISIIVFLGGIQIFVLGIAGLYIGRILKEVQNRPLYVIKEMVNFSKAKEKAYGNLNDTISNSK